MRRSVFLSSVRVRVWQGFREGGLLVVLLAVPFVAAFWLVDGERPEVDECELREWRSRAFLAEGERDAAWRLVAELRSTLAAVRADGLEGSGR